MFQSEFLGFQPPRELEKTNYWWLTGQESSCQNRRHGRHGFNPLVGRSPRVGNGNPFQYSCLENSMDREAWWNTIHGVAKTPTQLSKHEHSLWKIHPNWVTDFQGFRWLSGKEYTCQCRSCRFDPWVVKIPWRGRNGNPLWYSCLENQRVRHDWACTHITPLSHLMKEKKIYTYIKYSHRIQYIFICTKKM